MKWSIQKVFCCAGLVFALVSCSPRQVTNREDRLKWNLNALTNDYHSAGRNNLKWDKQAEEALTQFARINAAPNDDLEVRRDLAGISAENAVKAGCDDPMIKFLYCRYADSTMKFAERQEQARAIAKDMENSGYAPLWKFYANVSAAEILWQERAANLWPEVRQLRSLAIGDLNQALSDRTLPIEEAYQASETLFQLLARNTRELTNAYNTLETTLFKNGSKSAAAYLVRADFYLLCAWRARGNGSADQVAEEDWRLFHERLAESETALNKAWTLDPNSPQIPVLMLSVALGQQKPLPEMERWFQRAMKLEPADYQACRSKLHYLLPQWYGSREAMVAFGRECVAATNWAGHVPLTLVDAHSEFARTLPDANARNAYWQLPDVWPDIRAGYERFSEANPDATQFRYPYAAYAFRCGQWQDFNEQIKLIRQNDGEVRYNYFGGREAFNKMVAFAAHAVVATSAP
jgi:hypothetical protein